MAIGVGNESASATILYPRSPIYQGFSPVVPINDTGFVAFGSSLDAGMAPEEL